MKISKTNTRYLFTLNIYDNYRDITYNKLPDYITCSLNEINKKDTQIKLEQYLF